MESQSSCSYLCCGLLLLKVTRPFHVAYKSTEYIGIRGLPPVLQGNLFYSLLLRSEVILEARKGNKETLSRVGNLGDTQIGAF